MVPRSLKSTVTLYEAAKDESKTIWVSVEQNAPPMAPISNW